MNWKTLTLTVGALLILPLSVNAAESNRTNQNLETNIETNNMEHHTQIARRGKRGDRGDKIKRMLQQLDLTSEQSQQIETIKERSQSASEELREQLQTQRQTMKSLLSGNATTEEIREQHLIAQNLHQQLDNNRFETMLEIRDILTAEQKAKMAELIESHRDRRNNG